MKKLILNSLLLLIALTIGNNAAAQTKKWTLEECVNYALKNNISIKQSDLDNQSAAVEKSSAIGAFLPTINANATHAWNIGLNTNVITNALENQTTQNTSLGLSS